MQTYCVNIIGAACALVLVFPNTTMSGNPGNCGNACSCTKSVRNSRDKTDIRFVKASFFPSFGKDNADLKKQCPAVIPCVACESDDAAGVCVSGDYAGCSCTECPSNMSCSDRSCQGDVPDENRGYCNGPLEGCICSDM